MKKLSRQALWQRKRNAEGKCAQCGEGELFSSVKCKKCLRKTRIRQREKLGLKAWHKGGKGKPPILTAL